MNFKQTTQFLAVSIAALTIATGSAQAQTQAITADVTVQNTLTLAAASNLNWGTIAAVGDPVLTAAVAMGTDGTLAAPTTGGGTALIAVVDNALATAAQITVQDGANGVNVNVEINNVVNPLNGANSFTLDTFFTSYNGGADAAQVAAVPFIVVFDSAFGGGVNTLDIGASITTLAGAGAYGDGAYAGGFDVVFSY